MALIPEDSTTVQPFVYKHIEVRKELDEDKAEIYYCAHVAYDDPNHAVLIFQDWMIPETCSDTKEECMRKLIKLIASNGDYAVLRGLRVDEISCGYDFKEELAEAKRDLARRRREYPELYAAQG